MWRFVLKYCFLFASEFLFDENFHQSGTKSAFPTRTVHQTQNVWFTYFLRPVCRKRGRLVMKYVFLFSPIFGGRFVRKHAHIFKTYSSWWSNQDFCISTTLRPISSGRTVSLKISLHKNRVVLLARQDT